MLPARLAAGVARADTRSRFRGARIATEEAHLRPHGVGGILDAAMDVLSANFLYCVGIASLCALPIVFVPWYLALFKLAFFVPVHMVTTGLLAGVVHGHVVGRPIAPADNLRETANRLPGLVLIAMFATLLATVLTCACVLPVFLVYWLFSAVPVVHVLGRPQSSFPVETTTAFLR